MFNHLITISKLLVYNLEQLRFKILETSYEISVWKESGTSSYKCVW